MMTMGSDFQFSNALQNFKNMDKLIKYVNERVSLLNLLHRSILLMLKYVPV